MIADFFKALGQLPDPAFRAVLRKTLLLSLVAFAALVVALWIALSQVVAFQWNWLNTLLEFLGGLAVFYVALLLFPGIVGVVISYFLEDAVLAVEAKHYRDLGTPRAQPVHTAILLSLRFAVIVLVVNLIALPLYAVLILLPPLNLFVFYVLNGYLLGREYFELVALRRLEAAAAGRMRRQYRGRVVSLGVAAAFLFTVPLVNLIAPLIVTAWMVHVFERIRRAGWQPREV